jgi:hypothetical protein
VRTKLHDNTYNITDIPITYKLDEVNRIQHEQQHASPAPQMYCLVQDDQCPGPGNTRETQNPIPVAFLSLPPANITDVWVVADPCANDMGVESRRCLKAMYKATLWIGDPCILEE